MAAPLCDSDGNRRFRYLHVHSQYSLLMAPAASTTGGRAKRHNTALASPTTATSLIEFYDACVKGASSRSWVETYVAPVPASTRKPRDLRRPTT